MFLKYLYLILLVAVIIDNINCNTTDSIEEVTEGIIKTDHRSSHKSLQEKRIKNRKTTTEPPTEQELSEKQKEMTKKCVARMEKRMKKYLESNEGAVNITEASFPQCDYTKRTRKTYSRKGSFTHHILNKHFSDNKRRSYHRKFKKYVKVNTKTTPMTTRKPREKTTKEPTHMTTTDNILITMNTTNSLLQE